MSDPSKQATRVAIITAVIGGICTIMAAIIGLSAPVVERLMNAQPAAQSPFGQSTSAPATVSIVITATANNLEAERASIMLAINLLGTIESQALYDLDPAPLSTVFSGEALKIETTTIENLKKNNLYQISVRSDIRFEEINVSPDGIHADARVIPTWESKVYSSATKQCLGYLPAAEVPQTLYLEKTSAGWIIYAIAFDDPQGPPWEACP